MWTGGGEPSVHQGRQWRRRWSTIYSITFGPFPQEGYVGSPAFARPSPTVAHEDGWQVGNTPTYQFRRRPQRIIIPIQSIKRVLSPEAPDQCLLRKPAGATPLRLSNQSLLKPSLLGARRGGCATVQVMPARLRDVTTAQFDLPFEDNGRAQTPQGVCQRGRKGGRRSLILVVIAPTGGGAGARHSRRCGGSTTSPQFVYPARAPNQSQR